jgi:hypothetical protein
VQWAHIYIYRKREKYFVPTWNKCSMVLVAMFFLLCKTNALHGKISSFQQTGMESIPEAWRAYPYHGMDEWLVLQSFNNGLTPTSRVHFDAVVGGAFLDLTISIALVEKMVSN